VFPVLALLAAVAADLQAAQEPLPGPKAAHSARALLGARPLTGARGARARTAKGAWPEGFALLYFNEVSGWDGYLDYDNFLLYNPRYLRASVSTGFGIEPRLEGVCEFPANGTEAPLRFFDGAWGRVQIQGTLSTVCTVGRYEYDYTQYPWRKVLVGDGYDCTATLNGGASVQCADAQAASCTNDRG
jgi:hypothetical protein